jgi:phage tail-like protein
MRLRAPIFRYLGLDGRWPGRKAVGLTLDADGVTRLAPVAGDAATLVDAAAGAIVGAAGIGVDREGTVYVADAERHTVEMLRCDGSVERFGCVEGPGDEIGQVRSPRAVLVGPRAALYVADTGNRRVEVFDLATGQVTAVWTGFVEPVDLTADDANRIYVADRRRPRIARYDADGREDTAFGDAVAGAERAPQAPRAIATLVRGGNERLLVVDVPAASAPALLAFDLDGRFDQDLSNALAGILLADVASAQVAGDVLYVATAGGVLAFGFDGSFLGRLPETYWAAAALALDCANRLVVAGGAGVVRLTGTRRVTRGHVLAGPVPLVATIPRWDRVVAVLESPLAPGAHLRIWTRVGLDATLPPPPPDVADLQEVRERTPVDVWRPAPSDANDALVLHDDAPVLWIWVELEGDGTSTPELSALRVEWIGLGLLETLPAIYANGDPDETAWRLFALLGASLVEVEEEIDDLRLLFEPAAVPDRLDAPWLDALAASLALSLERPWRDALRRRLVAEAFIAHGRRGTRRSLEEILGRAAGTTVTVTEPADSASLWQLGEDGGGLGATTMLAAAEADGAIVGWTAEVDQSHLLREEDFGWSLFADVAHRFCVHVPGTAIDDVRLAALQAAIEREKPAHTLAHVCVLQPQTSVGFQSRVEMDMYVGAPPPTLELGEELNYRHALKNADRRTVGGRVGETTRVGRSPIAAVVGGHR